MEETNEKVLDDSTVKTEDNFNAKVSDISDGEVGHLVKVEVNKAFGKIGKSKDAHTKAMIKQMDPKRNKVSKIKGYVRKFESKSIPKEDREAAIERVNTGVDCPTLKQEMLHFIRGRGSVCASVIDSLYGKKISPLLEQI